MILHGHPEYATALSTLADPVLKPIDQNTARFFGLIAYDTNFGGLGDTAEEGARLAAALGNRPIMMMGNHGVLVTAHSVAHAFERLYFLEKAAKTLLLAYASGQSLAILPDALAQATAEGWRAYDGMADAHFAHLKTELDPAYAD